MGNNNHESTWSQIEKHLNLQSISEFIRHGGDVAEVDKRRLTERLAAADKDLQEQIENICGKDKTDNILEQISACLNIYKDIYFVLGMKTGAQIITLLTGNTDSNF